MEEQCMYFRHLTVLSFILVSVGCQSPEVSEEASEAAPPGDSETAEGWVVDEEGEPEADASDVTGADTASDAHEDPGELDDNPGSDPEPDPEPPPTEGFGSITGVCGVIDAAVREQPEPMMIQNDIDFADDPYDETDYGWLTEGGQEVLTDGNAGGSSLYSEVFAFEVLTRCEGAVLIKTETEILYDDPQGKKTDLLITIEGEQLGVSVTRAVGFPREDPYTVERAQALLEQKLEGIVSSSLNVSEGDSWNKQILHLLAYEPEHAASLAQAFTAVSPVLTSNTIVVVTVASGDDAFLY